jgi:hypothetical protein
MERVSPRGRRRCHRAVNAIPGAGPGRPHQERDATATDITHHQGEAMTIGNRIATLKARRAAPPGPSRLPGIDAGRRHSA